MDKSDVLSNLELGNGVAEYDSNLSKYYITTNATRDFVNGRYDIVRGTKGSGKTAMLIAVQKNQEDFRVLNGIKLLPVIQLKGDPEYVKALME